MSERKLHYSNKKSFFITFIYIYIIYTINISVYAIVNENYFFINN